MKMTGKELKRESIRLLLRHLDGEIDEQEFQRRLEALEIRQLPLFAHRREEIRRPGSRRRRDRLRPDEKREAA